ncbi:MAG: tetratricopeptide repeat protein, partial [Geopsychrobacter sp.]|nr:tetratricopeptide repeat protein [Geopsychrobacter sp.]
MKLLLQFCLLALLLGLTLPCVADSSLVDHYRKALDADPQNPTLRYHLGVALLNQGENKQAIKAFRRAYPTLSDDAEINFNLALAYSRISDPDSALIYLDQAAAETVPQTDVYPLNTIYFNLVILYEQQGRLDDAVVLLKRLLRENPTSLDSLRMLAEFQLRLGRVDEATLLFSDYLKRAPTDSEMREYIFASLFNRGLKAYENKEFKRATIEFKRVLQFRPESSLVLYYLSLLDYQQQNFERIAERLPQLYERLN